MQWYYASQGKQAGPVDDAGLDNLIQQGVVQPHTLVWREGMASWQSLSAARPGASPAAPPQVPQAPPAPRPAPVSAPAPQAYTPPAPQPVQQQPMAPAPQPHQPQQSYGQPQYGQTPQGYGPPAQQQPQYGQPAQPSFGQPAPPPAARPQASFEQLGFGQPKAAGDYGAPIAGAVAGGMAGAMGAMSPTAQTITCVNCGQLFPSSAAVMIGSSWVCGNCKPVYMQRMREGGAAASSTGMQLAGFWIRFGAYVIDSIIVSIAVMLVFIPIGALSGSMMVTSNGEVNPAGMAILGLAYLLTFVAVAGYHGYFLSTKGATPGKQVLGLKVIRTNGAPLTMGRAIGRFFAYMISGMPLYIGFFMIGFDKEKRALHDMICDTRVITTR